MDEGILIYAHNNELIDYARMAYCCALLAKHHLQKPVCLATDHETWTDFKTQPNRIDVFDDVKIIEKFDPRKSSRRNYGSHTGIYYHNRTREMAYDITPFKKTLVLDSDYLVLDDKLNLVWSLERPMMANRRIVGVSHPLNLKDGYTQLSDISIPMYWATVFYFEKNEVTESFFTQWEKVSKHFDFYSQIYNYRSAMYRNDFAFSVAEHALADYDYQYEEGLMTREPFCGPLPVPYMLTSWDTDEVMDIDRSGVLLKTNEMPCKVTSSFHCMNKVSLQRHLPKIVELYE